MRSIHLARLDTTRPVVVLTRDVVRERLTKVTIAPITSRIRGLSVEVTVGPANGLDIDSVINCDNVTTISVDDLGRHIGYLTEEQEVDLACAIIEAFDLEADVWV